MSDIHRPAGLKHDSKFISSDRMKAHKEAQAKRKDTRPGYTVINLHTDYANTKTPSVEAMKYACKEYHDETGRWPNTLWVPRALVKWCIFYEDGVKTELLVKEWGNPEWCVSYEGED